MEKWCNKKCEYYIKYSKSGKIFRGNVLRSGDKDNEDNLNQSMLNNCVKSKALEDILTFKRRIKSHLPFAGIIRSSPYSPRFQDNG